MEITDIQFRQLYPTGRLRALVSVTFDHTFAVHDIKIIDNILHKDGKIFFKIKCHVSKGTYIRSLVRDIGNKLGVKAVMNSLVRTRLGEFTLDNANTIDEIKNGKYNLIKIEDAFPDIKRMMVSDDEGFKIKNGCPINRFVDTDKKFIFDKDNNLIALYRNDDDKARVYKMF